MSKKIMGFGVLVASLLLLGGCVSRSEELVNSQEISVENIEEISISYRSDSINFYQSQTDEIRLEEYLIPRKGNQKADVTTSGKKLTITGGKREKNWFVFNNDSRIDIYLPKNYQEQLAVEVASGDITGESLLKLTEFSAKATSGNLEFRNIDARKINLAVSSGEISAKQLYADETIVDTTSGNIELGKVLSKKLTAHGSSGEIDIEQFRGDATLSITSGNLTVEDIQGSADMSVSSGEISANFRKVTGDITAATTSGNIELTLPKNLAFHFESQLTSGNISTYFSDNLEKNGKTSKGEIGQDPKIAVFVKATSGNIEIEAE